MVLPDIFKTRLDLLLQNEAHIQNEIDSVFEESQESNNTTLAALEIVASRIQGMLDAQLISLTKLSDDMNRMAKVDKCYPECMSLLQDRLRSYNELLADFRKKMILCRKRCIKQMEQLRKKEFSSNVTSTSKRTTANSANEAASQVTSSLNNMMALLSSQVQASMAAASVAADSSKRLRETKANYHETTEKLSSSKAILQAIKRQAMNDNFMFAFALLVFAAVVAFIAWHRLPLASRILSMIYSIISSYLQL